MKAFLPFWTTIFHESGPSGKVFITIITLMNMGVLYYRVHQAHIFNKDVFKWIIICESVLFWFSVSGVIHAVISYPLLYRFWMMVRKIRLGSYSYVLGSHLSYGQPGRK